MWNYREDQKKHHSGAFFVFYFRVINTIMTTKKSNSFHIEFLNPVQKIAWAAFQQHDVLFLTGSAGSGKTFLSVAFAINEILQKKKKRIILTRPIVEAGESLGYLPGSFTEKVDPYMMPLYDNIMKLVGTTGPQREMIDRAIEVAPISYMRGRTFSDSICILDEAQNCSMAQFKLYLSRFDTNSKIIVTGDPMQSDLRTSSVALTDVMRRLETIPGIGIVKFTNDSIVRHQLVGKILERLDE